MAVTRLMDQSDGELIFEIFVGSLMLIAALCFVIYKICFDTDDENEYRLLASEVVTNDIPRDFLNDDRALARLADTYDFGHLFPEEQTSYLNGEEFTVNNPPLFNHARGKSYTPAIDKIIKDCGIDAFFFEQDAPTMSPRFVVADKTEINFMNNDIPYSTATAVLNYALPVRSRSYSDTVYFETKIFEYEATPNSHFSIGLVTKPYPSSFRLPGYNSFSIGYESTGNLKINKPFPTPLQQHQGEQSEYNALVLPALSQSDVVGFGYVVSSGTIFITRNGKKILDIMKGCYVDLYPAIGCFSTNAKFQVNLGQMGFVWIEANVRKYGFVSTSDFKKLGGDRGLAALPGYENAETDKILDKGDDLPPRYPDEELDFFGRSIKTGTSSKFTNLQTPQGGTGKETIENEKLKPAPDTITDDPDEVMDLRQRLYEQKLQNSSESSPLIGNTPDIDYDSTTDKSKQDKQPKATTPSDEEVNAGTTNVSTESVQQTQNSSISEQTSQVIPTYLEDVLSDHRNHNEQSTSILTLSSKIPIRESVQSSSNNVTDTNAKNDESTSQVPISEPVHEVESDHPQTKTSTTNAKKKKKKSSKKKKRK